jgi:hypothetical protein
LAGLAVPGVLLETAVFDFQGDETIDPAFVSHLDDHFALTGVSLIASGLEEDCPGGSRLELYRFGKGFDQCEGRGSQTAFYLEFLCFGEVVREINLLERLPVRPVLASYLLFKVIEFRDGSELILVGWQRLALEPHHRFVSHLQTQRLELYANLFFLMLLYLNLPGFDGENSGGFYGGLVGAGEFGWVDQVDRGCFFCEVAGVYFRDEDCGQGWSLALDFQRVFA